ncbi:acetyl-CoA decarbonylase/synthase complex subunit alpha/beta [Desulfonatronospira sp.]|uniref:acetyl-CoA decarbonylase/synthase complex subunit alpha/beta n=1 Tax=Desulfonatronospira sp. TaxID=1962951 RepID=UPI0025C38EA0|nr:acetyl-CoA decarbonylase/synthase complex subunit alpha/beta [Desulfonatronospira sp.]
MSKIIASAAIRGAHAIVSRAEERLKEAIDAKGPDEPVAFPNTGYYLPVIYALSGHKVEKLSDMEKPLALARDMLGEIPTDALWLPYLGQTLDSGIATLFAQEIMQGIRYVIGPSPVHGIYLGAADDAIMRQRGVEFVDGSAPGFAAVVGAAPDSETAVKIARELQQKSLYVFMAGSTNGVCFADQLAEEGVQLGWDTRLVPFDNEVHGQVYSLGFAARAAMSFGGVKPGDFKNILRYNKQRIFAFVIALGEVDDEKYATAAGAISYGFPTIADTDIPEILPTGVCTYEHVVSSIPHDKIVQKAIEVRGLKVTVTEIPIPLSYGPAFEGERVRKDDLFGECGGRKSTCCELLRMREMEEVEDGRIEVVGPEIDEQEPVAVLPLAIVVDVAGRKMQKDFEPILERQFHHLINSAEGIMHIGQRDIAWIRISRQAIEKGFKLRHIGDILHAKLLSDFPSIADKVQVTLYTEEDKVNEILQEARIMYNERDERLAGLKDESVDTFYSCSLCQSFAPNHVCVITPERLGLCGAYNWLDGQASYEIDPSGPNKPVAKGEVIDQHKGEWQGVNEFISQASKGNLERLKAYSILEDPMTSCGCFECIVALLPAANGVMVVDRDFSGMTPSGMTFSTLAGMVGGGIQTPGFLGVGKFYLGSDKFISAEGGFKRLVWMPSHLKERLRNMLQAQAEKVGEPDMLDKIADETVATTEMEVLEHMEKVGHPALGMDPMM